MTLNLLPSSRLHLNDFSHVETRTYPPQGIVDPNPHRSTPAHDLAFTFTFKSYAPKVFQKIRDFYDIDVNAYMQSVCGVYAKLLLV